MPTCTTFAVRATVVAMLFLSGCAGGALELGAAQKTKQLRPGMTYQEVVALLGEPAASQLEGGKLKVRWSLHEYFKGWVPYDMEFNAQTNRLTAWRANEAEYQKNQQQMMGLLGATSPTGAPETTAATPPTAPSQPGTAAHGDASYWTNALAGRKLVNFYTGSGYREQKELRLCRNGVFQRRSESGGFGGGVSMASQGGGSGRWQASGPSHAGVLTLHDNGGGRMSYKLKLGQDGVYLDGTRYLRDDAGC